MVVAPPRRKGLAPRGPPSEDHYPAPIHNSTGGAAGYSGRNRHHSDSDFDDNGSQRAPSDRTISEYMIANERVVGGESYRPRGYAGNRRHDRLDVREEYDAEEEDEEYGDRRRGKRSEHRDIEARGRRGDGSDIYATGGTYQAPSEISVRSHPQSQYSYRSYRSGGGASRNGHIRRDLPHSIGAAPSVASHRSGRSGRSGRSAGLKMEAMAAPNPFCPNIKGVCCLLLLINLGLILVALGFVIVIQFFEPLIVWILGIIFLIFGFLTLIGSLIYCVVVCRDAKNPRDVRPEDLHWTHYWHKSFGNTTTAGGSGPEIHYRATTPAVTVDEKYHHQDDIYSDRSSYTAGSRVGNVIGHNKRDTSSPARFSDRHSDRY